MPPARFTALVLPFATRLALTEVGLDLVRLREEAQTRVEVTPSS